MNHPDVEIDGAPVPPEPAGELPGMVSHDDARMYVLRFPVNLSDPHTAALCRYIDQQRERDQSQAARIAAAREDGARWMRERARRDTGVSVEYDGNLFNVDPADVRKVAP